MTTNVTTTTTTAPNGETTIQKVESELESVWTELSPFWQKVQQHLTTLETAARASTWGMAAITLYNIVKHMV
jgi:prophage DNA circulation protein